MPTLQEIAAGAEKVVETIAKVEAPILTGVGMFVPGAATVTVPMQAILPLLIPDIERALNDVVSGNNGDIFSALMEFVNHIRVGMPNSPVLSAQKAATASIAQDGLDASTAGSG
jgi:hypothetical protein